MKQMPQTKISEKFELSTRNEFTKVDCEVHIVMDGKELPSLPVLGAALEGMLETLKVVVKESFKVPPRV